MTERPPITQAMIDAYDEYTHLTLDRRSFIEKLTRLAGSGAAAAAIAPLLAADLAMAAILSWKARLDAVALGATGGRSRYEDDDAEIFVL